MTRLHSQLRSFAPQRFPHTSSHTGCRCCNYLHRRPCKELYCSKFCITFSPSQFAMLPSQMAEAAAVQHAGELLQSVSAGYGAVKPRDEAAAVAVEEASGRECAFAGFW